MAKPKRKETGKGKARGNGKKKPAKAKGAKKAQAKDRVEKVEERHDPLATDIRVAGSPGGGQVSPGQAEHDDDDDEEE
jgi:hypothetical protein